MKIEQRIIDNIYQATVNVNFEIGGILGSSGGDSIDTIVIDAVPLEIYKVCAYYPNIEFFNREIAKWQMEDIEFKGMFHLHFAGVKTLSKGDIQYINDIMNSMPNYIQYLFFPIYVLPDRELVCYRAIRKKNSINIYEEELEIIL